MDELRALLDRVYTHLVRLNLPAAALLQPGLGLDAIEEQVKDFPFRLPREANTLYQWRDGVPETRRDAALFPDPMGDWVFMSLEDAVTRYREQIAMAQGIRGNDWALLWDPRWFPVFENDVPTSLSLLGQESTADTAPVLYIDVEGGSHDVEYASMTHLMRVVAECYDAGAFFLKADGALTADAARVGAIRRQHETQRADVAVAIIERGSDTPGYARALSDVIRFHDPRAVAPLLRTLEQSAYTDTGAIVALGQIGDESVVEPLLRTMRAGASNRRRLTGMREWWAEALTYMNRATLLRAQARSTALQSVVLMAEQLDLRLPVEPFAALLMDPMTSVRHQAIWALARIGTAEARDALALCLSDPDDEVRLAAQQTLERFGEAE